MKNKLKNKGISLIVLVITIIVIIILAGAVILSLNQNNPISKAKEAVFKSDISNFKSDLETYNITQLGQKLGGYEKSKLNADKNTLEYAGQIESEKTMLDVIPTMKRKTEYTEKLIVSEGKLVYIGNNPKERDWAEQIDVNNDVKKPTVGIELPNPDQVKQGTPVTYTIKFTSSNKISNFKKENIELLTKDKQSTTNPITVGDIGGTDTEKTVEVTIDTTNLETNEYILQVKAGTITDEVMEVTNKEVYSESFTLDNTVPGVPEILVEPTSITNGNVTVTINYSQDTTNKEYKKGSGSWQTYNGSFIIEENVDIIAKATNRVSTETMGEVVAIRNIDKQAPTITLATTATTTSSITIKATATDTGTAGIDANSYEYSKDDGATWTTASTSTEYTFSNLTTGTYKLKARVKDKANNQGVSSTLTATTQGMETLGNIEITSSTTAPTNQNITVTINYPTGIATKQYKIGTGSWQNYTGVLTITENTDILAKGMDAGGNVLEIADALSIRNIDKQAPTITLATTATTTSSITIKATATDVGTAGINTSSYEYSKDDGATWTTASASTEYTFSNLTTGTYKLKSRVKDKANNQGVSSTLTATTQGMETLGNVTITPSTTAPTNGNITVTINYPTGIAVKQYKIGTGSWQNYTGTLTITENSDILAKGMDTGGNVLEIADALSIRNIDKVNPNAASISASSSNGRVTGTISVSDNTGGSGIDFTNSKYVINTTSTTYGATASIWSSATTVNTSPKSVNETKAYGTYYVHVLVVDKAGNKVVTKSSGIVVLNIGVTDPGWDASKGVNSPVLKTGMTPIKWNGSTWVNTTSSDSDWYDYTNKKWANAKTADGSFWVWIPRYEYKIPKPHSITAQTILVNFKQETSTSATSGYTVHPAFTFGSDALTGIWVAKFEASAREGVDNTIAGDNVTTKNVKIEPNVSSWRTIIISNMYDVVRKMETDATYGWGTSGTGIDTHLMKNIEWGAVAYLSHSTYGKNTQIWKNPYYERKDSNYDYKTGQAGSSVSAIQTTSTYTYETTNGMQASTTGNVTGIYDMSGGANEYTAAYVNNGSIALTANGSSVISAENKYKDVYLMGSSDTGQLNYEANKTKLGDAVYETSLYSNGSNSSWYGDYLFMPYSASTFSLRGGYSDTGDYTGVFSLWRSSGRL